MICEIWPHESALACDRVAPGTISFAEKHFAAAFRISGKRAHFALALKGPQVSDEHAQLIFVQIAKCRHTPFSYTLGDDARQLRIGKISYARVAGNIGALVGSSSVKTMTFSAGSIEIASALSL